MRRVQKPNHKDQIEKNFRLKQNLLIKTIADACSFAFLVYSSLLSPHLS